MVHQEKRKVVYSLPILIGFFVYGYAKLRMLEFYYDFLKKVVVHDRFELVQMDTDSMYFGLGSASLYDECYSGLHSREYARLVDSFIETDQTRRVPLLFKLEWLGNYIAALNAKCYFGQSDHGDKVSCKGIKHMTNADVLTYANYDDVIQKTKDFVEGENRGFKMVQGHMEQYAQLKTALTHFYIKRKVLGPDGVMTEPLDI